MTFLSLLCMSVLFFLLAYLRGDVWGCPRAPAWPAQSRTAGAAARQGLACGCPQDSDVRLWFAVCSACLAPLSWLHRRGVGTSARVVRVGSSGALRAVGAAALLCETSAFWTLCEVYISGR